MYLPLPQERSATLFLNHRVERPRGNCSENELLTSRVADCRKGRGQEEGSGAGEGTSRRTDTRGNTAKKEEAESWR